ncbi:uncharacterized protein LOC143421789 isoform X2 [Maylandia zebra]|uniref:uncharacterized protein LOC143421789 isoform X2 n=1 Tax=Maylandia zebra TaxID=106582 RepID=UPI00403CB599
MPANARVTLCYGPYKSSGVIQHRTFRLQGLQGLSHIPTRSHSQLVKRVTHGQAPSASLMDAQGTLLASGIDVKGPPIEEIAAEVPVVDGGSLTGAWEDSRIHSGWNPVDMQCVQFSTVTVHMGQWDQEALC